MNDREKLLAKLQEVTIEYLLKKIKSQDATHQDIKNAIQLLKDNDITCEIRRGTPLAELLEELPFNEFN